MSTHVRASFLAFPQAGVMRMLSRVACGLASVAASLLIVGAAQAQSLPRIQINQINGSLVTSGATTYCFYSGMTEDSQGGWIISCGAGPRKVTFSTVELGGATSCSTYAGMTEDASGDWLVTGCVPACAPTIQFDPPIPTGTVVPVQTSYVLKANVTAACSQSISKVEFYVDGGLQSTDTAAPYEWSWTPSLEKVYSLRATATSVPATGSPLTASVDASIRANRAPTITLAISPTTPRPAVAYFTLTAAVVEGSDGIKKVDFYLAGAPQPFATQTAAPYTTVWNGFDAGSYQFYAVVEDNAGTRTQSGSVAAQVAVPSANIPPTVSIEKPLEGEVVTGPVILEATAADVDGQVYFVRFMDYVTGEQIGTVTTPPYRVTWQNPPPLLPLQPAYMVYAYATDNSGIITQTPVRAFTRAPGVSPTVTLLVSPTSAVPVPNTGSAAATIAPAAGDTIASVQFHVNGQAVAHSQSGSTYTISVPMSVEGVYQVEVRATSGSGGVGVARSSIMGFLQANATSLDIPGTSTIGAIAASMDVGPSGAATYTIPIQVPPGVAGLEPSLAIVYNSQGGSGHLGAGFALSGLPSISRCPKTEATDGVRGGIRYATDDRFCLDGQRLISIGTGADTHGAYTEYRTEIDTYSRIRSYNDVFADGTWQQASPVVVLSPARFEVYTKAGRIMHFAYKTWVLSLGNGVAGRQNSIKVYPVDRIEDRAGNFIEIDYCGSNGPNGGFRPYHLDDQCNDSPFQTNAMIAVGSFPGTEHYPGQIRYGRNNLVVGSVSLDYVDRDIYDKYTMFDSGAGETAVTKRLNSIRTYARAASGSAFTLVKNYQLSYETGTVSSRSRLARVKECADEAATVCLGATTFTWAGDGATVAIGNAATSFPSIQYLFGNNPVYQPQIADFNGDGRSDVFQVRRLNGVYTAIVCPSGGASCSTWPTSIGDVGDPDGVLPGDYNGDGLSDMVLVYGGTNVALCLTNASATGFELPCKTLTVSGQPLQLSRAQDPKFQADFNGDGMIDFAYYVGDGYWRVHLATQGGFSNYHEVGPMTNDGVVGTDIQHQVVIGDVDGDGRADWILRRTNNDNDTTTDFINGENVPRRQQYYVCFSKFQPGATQPAVKVDCANFVNAVPGQVNRLVVMDFNGDGLADIAAPLQKDDEWPAVQGTRYWRVCLSTGDGAFNCGTYLGPNARDIDDRKAVENTVFGDFNGDGRTDMAAYTPSQGWVICLSRGWTPDLSSGVSSAPLLDFNCSFNAPGPSLANKRALAADFDGDGRTDILRLDDGPMSVYLATKHVPELVTSVADGLSASQTIAYAPLTDSSVYTKGPVLAGQRQVSIQSPMYVVKRTTASTGTPYPLTMDYSYENLLGDTTGRGLLGFQRTIATRTVPDEPAYFSRVETEFRQVWPGAGMPLSVKTVVAPAVGLPSRLVSEVTSQYEARVTPRGGGSATHELHVTVQRAKSFELNGAALPQTITETPLSNIDSVTGNITYTTTRTADGAGLADGYRRETSTTFADDVGDWLIGKVAQQSSRSFLPDASSLARVTQFTYFTQADGPKRGLSKSETLEPFGSAPDKVLTEFDYDANGNRTQVKKTYSEAGIQKSRNTTMSFESSGRFPESVTNALGQTSTETHDVRFGGVTEVNAPNSTKVETIYDQFGRRVSELTRDVFTLRPVSHTTWTQGPSSLGAARAVEIKANTGMRAISHVDILNRQIIEERLLFAGDWATSRTTFDSRGHKFAFTRPMAGDSVTNDRTTTWTYDALDRVVDEVDRNGPQTTDAQFRKTTTAYDVVNETDPGFPSAGFQPRTRATVTRTNDSANGGDQVTATISTSQGQMLRTVDSNGKETRFSYDHFGNLVCMTPSGTQSSDYRCANGTSGAQVRNQYDIRGRKKRQDDPDSGTSTFEYNGLGQVVSQVDANGASISTAYDGLGRIVSRAAGAFTTTWTYDSCRTGKLCSVSSSNGSARQFTYDNVARLQTSQLTFQGKTFKSASFYDSQGRPSVVAYPGDDKGTLGLSVRNGYNDFGYVSEVVNAASGAPLWRGFSFYGDGQPRQTILGATTYTRRFDTWGRPRAWTADAVDLGYTWDQIGNLITREEGAAPYRERFVHDKLNRLTSVTCEAGACASRTYGYDDVGNITSKSDLPGTYSYYAGTHRVSNAGIRSFAYDPAGNLQKVNDSVFATWTPFNMPATLGLQNELNYDYDGDFTRIREGRPTSVTYYSMPGQFEQTDDLLSGTKTLRYFINSPEGVIATVTLSRDIAGDDIAGKTFFMFNDHLGSPAAQQDDAGVVTRMSFDPWGKRRLASGADGSPSLSALGSDRGYTGHEMIDDFGLVLMNGRIYDPAIGRFLSPDPVVQIPSTGQGFNRYSYVMNCPLGMTDPTGYSWWTQWRKPVIAMIASIATAGAASALMLSAANTAMANTIFATWEIGAGAVITPVGTAAVGAAGGFAAGGIMGGNLQSALHGAFSAALSGGVGALVADASLPVQMAAKAGTEAAVAKASGGDWKRAAVFSAASTLARAGWEYTRRETDRLYFSACGQRTNCGYDEYGPKTDGGRNFDRMIKESEWNAVPAPIRGFVAGGMSMEDGEHTYDRGTPFCKTAGDGLCGAVRGFVRQVSKAHDWNNSWSYNNDTSSATFGFRIEGGGFSSLAARVTYEVGVQTWSLGTMLPMAAYTGFALYGDMFNPYTAKANK